MSDSNGGDFDETDNDSLSIAAAEFALGLVSQSDRQRLMALARRNPAFRAEISKWEEHFSHFADELEPVAPPDRVLRRIKSQISPSAPAASSHSAFRSKSRALWNNAGLWRGLAFACMSMLVGLSSYMVMEKGLEPPRKLVAAIATDNGPAAFVATYDPGRRQMLLVPSSLIDQASKRVPELWIVPKGLKPISLGVIDPAHPKAIIIPQELAPHARTGSSLVITLEPEGGAPGGVATGPAIAQGMFSAI